MDCHTTFSNQLSRLFLEQQVSIRKKFIETFSNGTVIYTVYTDEIQPQEKLKEITKMANVIFNIPESVLQEKLINREISGA